MSTLASTFVVSLLYMSLFFTLGLLISTRSDRQRLRLCWRSCWAMLTLVLPGLVVEQGKVLTPSPSRPDFLVERWKIEKDTWVAIREARGELGDDRAAFEVREAALTSARNRRMEALEAEYWSRVLSQAESLKRWLRLLPSGLLIHAMTGLVGTDVEYVSDYKLAQKQVKARFDASIDNPEADPVPATLIPSPREFGERLHAVVIDIALLLG